MFDSHEDRIIGDIVHAIPSVSPDQYTLEGSPRVDALELLLGHQITEAQRDQAHKVYLLKTGQKLPEPTSPAANGEEHETD